MECWQLQFNQVEEVCKLNISYKDKFSLEIKFNWLMRKKIKANLNESSRFLLNRTEENYRETATYLQQPGHHCLQLRRTTQISCTKNLFPYLGESTDENKALLFLLVLEVQFKLLAIPYNPLGYCFRFDLQYLKIL